MAQFRFGDEPTFGPLPEVGGADRCFRQDLAPELPNQPPDQQVNPVQLDPPGGGAGPAADHHQKRQQQQSAGIPAAVAGGGKTGGGKRRNRMEHGAAQGGGPARVEVAGPDQQNQGHPHRGQQQQKMQLAVAAHIDEMARQQHVGGQKVGPPQEHQHDGDRLNKRTVPVTDGLRAGGKSPGGHRGQGVVEGIEPAHAGEVQGQDAAEGVAAVELEDQLGRAPDIGRQPGRPPLGGPDPSAGRTGQGAQHDDGETGPAGVLQDAAKEQDQARRGGHVQHREAGGGPAAGGFKERLGEVQLQQHPKRHRSRHEGRQPGHHDDRGALGIGQFFRLPGAQRTHQQPPHRRDDCARQGEA